ncbi:MAG: hypothetical protein IJ042_06405 [Butyricicoccus sp.]|nr:hypothetical protein [Butyricicoccus sp.]
MLYISLEDFFEKTAALSQMSREEEILCAQRMQNGDAQARESLIRSYLPMTASCVRRAPAYLQDLTLVLRCQQTLEKAVDSFNFLQDSETFAHRLSWHLRQTVTDHIARLRSKY